jgi:hypothetical protein
MAIGYYLLVNVTKVNSKNLMEGILKCVLMNRLKSRIYESPVNESR